MGWPENEKETIVGIGSIAKEGERVSVGSGLNGHIGRVEKGLKGYTEAGK